VFAGFPSELLGAVKTMPKAMEYAVTFNPGSKLGSFIRGVREFVGQTARLGTRDFFYTKVKESISSALQLDLRQLDIVLPPELLAAQDALVAGIKAGKVDKEIRGVSDALFDIIDQDRDGRVTEAEVKVYTDLFLEECGSDEDAKRRLLAIFGALDLNGNGSLSKDELVSFMSKVDYIVFHPQTDK